MADRSIPELLAIIGADDGLPFSSQDPRTVDAFQAGMITSSEARRLQSFGGRSPKSQRRALSVSRADTSDEAIEAMKAKLRSKMSELEAMRARRGDGVG